MKPKLIQIMSVGGQLYGLVEDGSVYRLVTKDIYDQPSESAKFLGSQHVWKLVTGPDMTGESREV